MSARADNPHAGVPWRRLKENEKVCRSFRKKKDAKFHRGDIVRLCKVEPAVPPVLHSIPDRRKWVEAREYVRDYEKEWAEVLVAEHVSETHKQEYPDVPECTVRFASGRHCRGPVAFFDLITRRSTTIEP